MMHCIDAICYSGWVALWRLDGLWLWVTSQNAAEEGGRRGGITAVNDSER